MSKADENDANLTENGVHKSRSDSEVCSSTTSTVVKKYISFNEDFD